MGTTIFVERYLGRQQGIKYNENNVSDIKKSYKLMAFFFFKAEVAMGNATRTKIH
jgi:hypothetical protein